MLTRNYATSKSSTSSSNYPKFFSSSTRIFSGLTHPCAKLIQKGHPHLMSARPWAQPRRLKRKTGGRRRGGGDRLERPRGARPVVGTDWGAAALPKNIEYHKSYFTAFFLSNHDIKCLLETMPPQRARRVAQITRIFFPLQHAFSRT